MSNYSLTFNSPLEVGLRSLALLVAGYPRVFDLNQLLLFDFIVIHTEQFGGIPNLHPENRYHNTELLVRRPIILEGLRLFTAKGLIEPKVMDTGFSYTAGDSSQFFLTALSSNYINALNERCDWVIEKYGEYTYSQLRIEINNIFEEWIEEFHSDIDGK